VSIEELTYFCEEDFMFDNRQVHREEARGERCTERVTVHQSNLRVHGLVT